jgi:hypothetical protein
MKIAKIKGFLVSFRKVVTVCACVLILISALFPFLTITHYTIIREDAYPVTYWSYKTTIRYVKLGYVWKRENLFFSAYWFAQQEPYSYLTPSIMGVSWVLVALFLAQILTLGFGFAALFGRRKTTQLLPLISCLFVTFLMVYMMVQTQSRTYGLPKYELGWWLSCLSTILFLCAFIPCLVIK